MKGFDHLPDLYFGREQSQAKHDILERYLTPFANKILSSRYWESLDFIDGFAGPWENNDHENLKDTSIGISLRTLEAVAESRKHNPSHKKIRCIFNEAKTSSYARLEAYAERARREFKHIEILTFKGKFADNSVDIKAASTNSFQLLFVDPTGYTGFPPSALKPFAGRSSEIIVNMMRSFIGRFIASEHEDREKALGGLIGTKLASQFSNKDYTIEHVEAAYLDMLRQDLGYKYAAYSPIHNPDKNEIQFNLAYATNHYQGLEVLRSAEFSALSSHDQTRAKKKDPGLENDLFAIAAVETVFHGPYLTARKAHAGRLRGDILEYLSGRRRVKFEDLCAHLQQRLFLKQTEIGKEVAALGKEGLVTSPWVAAGRRVPKAGTDIIDLIP
jgi:three-Cys-motif partner protein